MTDPQGPCLVHVRLSLLSFCVPTQEVVSEESPWWFCLDGAAGGFDPVLLRDMFPWRRKFMLEPSGDQESRGYRYAFPATNYAMGALSQPQAPWGLAGSCLSSEWRVLRDHRRSSVALRLLGVLSNLIELFLPALPFTPATSWPVPTVCALQCVLTQRGAHSEGLLTGEGLTQGGAHWEGHSQEGCSLRELLTEGVLIQKGAH